MILYLAPIKSMLNNSVVKFDSVKFGSVTIDNFTPHTINVFSSYGEKQLFSIVSSGVARAAESHELMDTLSTDDFNIPVDRVSYGTVDGLPPEKEGVFHVVSLITALQCVGKRNDLLIVSGTVRDDQGRIMGCTGFARV